MIRRLLLGLCLALACGAATAQVPVNAQQVRTPAGLTYTDPWYLQRELYRTRTWDTRWTDPVLNGLVDRAARRLEKANGLPRNFIAVDITTCPYASARAYVGGWVNICLPALLRMENEDEVAFVLAHEIYHVLKGHNLDMKEGPRTAHSTGAAELEADRGGMALLVRAGYSPDGAILFLDKALAHTPGAAERADLKRRADRLGALVAQTYAQASDEREFTPMPATFQDAASNATAYIAEGDRIYGLYVSGTAAAHGKGAQGDQMRHQNCLKVFGELSALADRRGFQEWLINIAAVANTQCIYYLKTDVNYAAFVRKHVRLQTVSYQTLGLLLLSVNISYGTDLESRILVELERRLFAPLPDEPSPIREPDRWMRNTTQARLGTTCKILGLYDFQAATDRVLNNPASRRRLAARVGHAPTLKIFLDGCQEALDHGREQRLKAYRDVFQTRYTRSGNTREQAHNIAEKLSRLYSINLFIADANAIVGLTNPYARRPD
ncbi:M48 family metalloprotease [Caulobacter sp. SLTY]|uniref:M48 family metallopeptidase n=1 Tax=Caulobacter sp. SLTY TaxID=2683262 RepID=UPI001411FA0B|nr:M48 family metallopeptidase [Caulobacter sp. SLTY]NBB16308.1 M48 family metalloprotease [Caulobacter sp. SLTY]